MTRRPEMPPLVLPYHDIAPVFAGPLRNAGPMSAVAGRVTMGTGAWLGEYTLVRGDGHFVQIGHDFLLGSESTVHIAHEVYPAIIGDRVVVGRNAVVHACTVGDDCVIGDGVVVLDGSLVESGVVLEPGALIYPRSHLASGHVYAGRPAKPLRAVSPQEVRAQAAELRRAQENGRPVRPPWSGEREHRGDVAPSSFIAATARLRGSVHMAESSSVFFACDVDAGAHQFSIGENSNIQDNTIIRCDRHPFTLGANAVIGHNVKLGGCTIGDGALVGIGSDIAEGTRIDAGVLVAAGTRTGPDQHLESGWLWGGDPARALSRMNESRHEMIRWTVHTYTEYAQAFAAAQRALGRSTPHAR